LVAAAWPAGGGLREPARTRSVRHRLPGELQHGDAVVGVTEIARQALRDLARHPSRLGAYGECTPAARAPVRSPARLALAPAVAVTGDGNRQTKRRQTAPITGASPGIGAALAHCVAQGGRDLVLVAGRASKLRLLAHALEAAHPVRLRTASTNALRPRSAQALAAAMRRRRLAVDILVNNAGAVELRRFAVMPSAPSRQLVALNVVAATGLLSCFLPPMIRRDLGRVLNVCAIGSFLPVPSMAIYAATKACLRSLREGLSEERAGTGVTITALRPSATKTPIKAAIERAHPHVPKLSRLAIADAGAVGLEGYEACMRGEALRVLGLVNRLTTLLGRALRRWLARRVADAIGRQAL
jgi:uncharacterized protein